MEKRSFDIKPFLILFAGILFSAFCIDMTQETLFRWQYLIFYVSSAIIFAALFKSLNLDDVSVIIFVGIMLKVAYIFYTATWTRQHDVVDFGTGEGHAGYIEYIIEHEALPDFDPRSVWAFFQPPLHHIISAIWVKCCLYVGTAYRQAQENIQLLTLFYTSSTVLFSYFICKELNLKKWGMRVAMLIISFHPIYIMLSGSINNDALSLMFMTISIYLIIVWYRKPEMIYIVLLALSIGCSMIAKLSGGMVAPAIGLLFLIKLWNNIKMKKNGETPEITLTYMIAQYVVFGLIVVPVGLSWTIRNMKLFNMPVNYIPPVGERFNYTLAQRLCDWSMNGVFPAMEEYGDPFYEHNVFLALIKSSLFGEYNYGQVNPYIIIPSIALFVVSCVLIILGIVATVYIIFINKDCLKSEHKVLFFVLYLTLLISYFSFALSYDNFSAQDFRYLSLSVVVQSLFLGLFTDEMREKSKYFLIMPIVSYIFGFLSIIVYVGLGLA